MRMYRSAIIVLSILCMTLVLERAAAAHGPVHVVVDGRYLGFDVAPRIENDRVLVPWRWLMEFYGFAVQYREEDRSISTTGNGRTIEMRIGEAEALINGRSVILDVPPVVESGRVLVPLRFISEALGYAVDWDGQTRTVTVSGHGERPAAIPALPLEQIRSVRRSTVRHSPVTYKTYEAANPDDQPVIAGIAAAWAAAVPAAHPQMSFPMAPYGTAMTIELEEGAALVTLAWSCWEHPDGGRSCTNGDEGYAYLTTAEGQSTGLVYAPDLVSYIHSFPITGGAP